MRILRCESDKGKGKGVQPPELQLRTYKLRAALAVLVQVMSKLPDREFSIYVQIKSGFCRERHQSLNVSAY